MSEMMEDIVAKLTEVADRILDSLIGKEPELREAKVRIPDARSVLEAHLRMRRLPPVCLHCDW